MQHRPPPPRGSAAPTISTPSPGAPRATAPAPPSFRSSRRVSSSIPLLLSRGGRGEPRDALPPPHSPSRYRFLSGGTGQSPTRGYRSDVAIQPAIWARELKPSLFRMLRTWLSTVRSEMNSRAPHIRGHGRRIDCRLALTAPARIGSFLPARYNIPMATLVWRVHELAARRGWSAGRLAEKAGLDQKTVRNILAGRATRVDLDTIARLSNALDVKPGALWRTDLDRAQAWHRTAGSAGPAAPGELAEALSGARSDLMDPALERATRSS